jgi:hypothetical protein
MKKNTSKDSKKGGSHMSKTGMAAAAAGAAAVGAGAYYLLGPNAKAHQKKVSTIVSKMKKEVEKQAKKAEDLSTPIYHKVVDAVAENYAKQYKMHENDIRYIAQKIKQEWLAPKKKKAVKRSTKKTSKSNKTSRPRKTSAKKTS